MKTNLVSLETELYRAAVDTLHAAVHRAVAELPRVAYFPSPAIAAEGGLWETVAAPVERLMRHYCAPLGADAEGTGIEVIDALSRAGLSTGSLPWRLAMSSLVGVPRARAAGVLEAADVDAFIVDAAVLGIDGAIDARSDN